jgi:hypothetical protein
VTAFRLGKKEQKRAFGPYLTVICSGLFAMERYHRSRPVASSYLRSNNSASAAPAAVGLHSHMAFCMSSGGRRVELHRLSGVAGRGAVFPPPPSPEEDDYNSSVSFGLRLVIDESPRRIERIVLWMLEPGSAADSPLLHVAHLVGPRGERAFELLFNSEVLVPGDEARVVGELLSGGAVAGRLDLGSLKRARAALGGLYVPSVVGFNRNGYDTGRDGVGVFTLCTCSAYPVASMDGGGKGGWKFHLFEFDIHYCKANGGRQS